MRAIIDIETTYGFCHNWILHVRGRNFAKAFYLGQDIKFLHRVMGCEPSDVAMAIGSLDLRKESVRKKLAHYILDRLELTPAKLRKMPEWALCCQ